MAELDIQRLRTQLLLLRRELLVGVGLLVVSVGLLIFVAMPQWNRLQVIEGDIKQEETTLQRIQQRASLLSDISPEDQAQFSLVGLALPLGKQPLIILQTLEEVAGEAGVSLGKYDLNPGVISTQAAETTTRRVARAREAASSQALSMPVSVEIVGEFADIHRTLELIEETLPLMEVIEISLNPEKQVEFSTPTTSYRVSLLIHTYYSPLDARELARQGAAPLTPAQQEALETISGLEYRLLTTPEEQSGPPPQFDNANLFGSEVGVPTPLPATPTPTPQPTPLPEEAPVGPEET